VALVLVDTSIWIDVERGRFDLEAHVDVGEIAICPPIAQELLQGARDRERYRIVWDIIFAARMIDDPVPLETFEEAAQIHRHCLEDGYRIASSFDCLIASCAIRNKAKLLQRDHDFEKIAEVAPLELIPNR
jgi:predicted nucleic acid-binding protein